MLRPFFAEARADVREVLLQRQHDHGRVAPTERGEDREVDVGRPLGVRPGDHERQVRARKRLQRPPHALQRGVARGVDESGVEAGVGDRDRVSITRARGSLHLLPELDQLGEVGLGELRDGQAGTQRLQLGPDHVGLEELARRGMANAGAPEGRDLDEAQRLESAQGLADGRLAGPELARYPRFDDPGVRRVVPGEDRLQEPVPDLVCKDGARDGSVFGDSVVGHCGSSRLHRVVPAMSARVPRSLARRDPPRGLVAAAGARRSPPPSCWMALDGVRGGAILNNRLSTIGRSLSPVAPVVVRAQPDAAPPASIQPQEVSHGHRCVARHA